MSMQKAILAGRGIPVTPVILQHTGWGRRERLTVVPYELCHPTLCLCPESCLSRSSQSSTVRGGVGRGESCKVVRGRLSSAFPRRPITKGKAAGKVRHDRLGQKMQAGSPSLDRSLRRWAGQIGQNLGLVHGIQQVLGIHGQGVGSCEHLPLAVLTQGCYSVLLSQPHLVDELCQVFVEKFLGPFNLVGKHTGEAA